MEDGKYYETDGLGTPQGGVLSPLLANIYLHSFDKMFQMIHRGAPRESSTTCRFDWVYASSVDHGASTTTVTDKLMEKVVGEP